MPSSPSDVRRNASWAGFLLQGREACFLAGVLVLWTVLLWPRFDAGTGLTSLIQFGADWETKRVPVLAEIPHHVRTPTGYDGQFYVQVALDPLLREPETTSSLDLPQYRSRRILLSWLGWLAGGGQPWWIVHLFPLLNLLLHLGWAWLLLLATRSASDNTRTADGFRYAMIGAVLLTSGAIESVRCVLPDLLLAAMVCAAAWCWDQKKPGLATALLMGAGLAKETGLLAVAGIFLPIGQRLSGRLLWWAGWAVLPMGLWWFYLHRHLPMEPANFTGNLGWPVYAWVLQGVHCLRQLVEAGTWSAFFALFAWIGLLVQAVWLLIYRKWTDSLGRVGLAFAGLYLCLDTYVWEVHLAACRAVLPLTFVFNWHLWREQSLGRMRWVWLFAGNFGMSYGFIKFMVYTT